MTTIAQTGLAQSGLAQAALAIGAIVAMLAAMAALRRLAEARDWPAEVRRKAVHVGAGSLAMALPWVFAEDWPIYLLLALTMAVMIALRLPAFAALGGTVHGVERRSWGDLLLVVSVGLLLLFADGIAVLYVLPLAILTLADAAAALAGTSYGRHSFAVPGGRKSIEGTAVFFLVTLLVAMVCLLLLSEVPRLSVIVIAVALAAFATLVELDSWHGFDNLFLPMGALIFLDGALVQAPADIALTTLAFLSALALFGALAARLGITAQSVRAAGMALFLILSVTAAQNAILPAAMLLAQLAAQDGATRGSGLDTIAALAAMGFGFLALGEATGQNALAYFGLAAAAITSGHLARSLHRTGRLRHILALTAAVALWGLWSGVQSLNPSEVLWAPGLPMAAATVLVATSLLASARPDLLQGAVGMRVAGLGAVPVAALYLVHVAMEAIP